MIFFLLHEVMQELVTAKHPLGEEEVTNVLWHSFCLEVDINIISERSTWTISDLALKSKQYCRNFEVVLMALIPVPIGQRLWRRQAKLLEILIPRRGNRNL